MPKYIPNKKQKVAEQVPMTSTDSADQDGGSDHVDRVCAERNPVDVASSAATASSTPSDPADHFAEFLGLKVTKEQQGEFHRKLLALLYPKSADSRTEVQAGAARDGDGTLLGLAGPSRAEVGDGDRATGSEAEEGEIMEDGAKYLDTLVAGFSQAEELGPAVAAPIAESVKKLMGGRLASLS